MPAKKKVLLVTYDLRSAPEERQKAIFETLQECPGWWHYLDSTWLVVTRDSPTSLVNKLLPHLTQSERLLVTEFTPRRYQGWLPEKAWEWINAHAVTTS